MTIKVKGLFPLIVFFFITTSALGQASAPHVNRDSGKDSSDVKVINLESKKKSKISGTLVDESSQSSIAFANISLQDSKTSKIVDGTIANEDGKFEFKKLNVGLYNIIISLVGYQTSKIENIEVKDFKDIILGALILKRNSIDLDGVIVTAEKQLIEEKVDRLIYHAEKDLSATGGDASDLLKNVPLLNVDQDGNLSMRGSENIQVLINNKPTSIMASSIADALKMIPAETIKTVEVITSPSAKYDAEGIAGIVNIITKKNTTKGGSLQVNGAHGLRSSNLGANGFYRHNNLGISFGVNQKLQNKKSREENFNENLTSGLTTEQFANEKTKGNTGRYTLGFDYSLKNRQYLYGGFSIEKKKSTKNSTQINEFFLREPSSNVLEKTRSELRDSKGFSGNATSDFSLDYIKIFKNNGEWSISTLLSSNVRMNDNYINFWDNAVNKVFKKQWNDNDNKNNEFAAQTDLITPLKENGSLELGAKTLTRSISSAYDYYLSQNVVSNDMDFYDLPKDPKNPGGDLKYKQNITSIYSSYTYTPNKQFSVKIGGRLEYTSLEAQQNINQGTENTVVNRQPFSSNYPTFVPSINISKSVGDISTKLSYNYRIKRPGIKEINPNIDISDPLNIKMGTTNLAPQKTHNAEFSVSKYINKNYIRVAVFGKHSSNSITKVSMTSQDAGSRYSDIPELSQLDPSAIVSTYENIGTESLVGTDFFSTIYCNKSWSFNTSIELLYFMLEGKEFIKNEMHSRNNADFSLNAKINTQIKLNKKMTLQANARWKGQKITVQGETKGRPGYSLSFRYEPNKKLNFTLNSEDFLGSIKNTNRSRSEQFIRNETSYKYEQNLLLAFTYKLGDIKLFKTKKRRITNDETDSDDEE